MNYPYGFINANHRKLSLHFIISNDIASVWQLLEFKVVLSKKKASKGILYIFNSHTIKLDSPQTVMFIRCDDLCYKNFVARSHELENSIFKTILRVRIRLTR